MSEENNQEIIDKIKAIVKEHEDKRHSSYGASLDKRVDWIIRGYSEKTASAISESKQIVDDVVTYFRAVTIIAESIGNASTHAEKGARLRGLIEMLESAITSLRKVEFGISSRNYGYIDLFRSNFPMAHYLEQIHTLQYEKEELQKQLGIEISEDKQAPNVW